MRVGIVGTSKFSIVDKNEVRKIILDIMDQLPNTDIEIVVGGGVVSFLFLKEAQKRGMQCIQIAPNCVKTMKCPRMTIGEELGDEECSAYFINYIDSIIRIGGGPQSHHEIKLFKLKSPIGLIIEKELNLKL